MPFFFFFFLIGNFSPPFLSLLGLEPGTFHKPTPIICHLSQASRVGLKHAFHFYKFNPLSICNEIFVISIFKHLLGLFSLQ